MDQQFTIKNNRGQSLAACLSHQNYRWLIILCHGYSSNKDFATLKKIAALLNQNHFSTLRFDFSGSGASEGSKNLSLIQQVADLKSIIAFAVKYQHVILVSHSLGAIPVCICSSLPQISGIVTINGFFGGKIYRPDFKRAYRGLKLASLFFSQVRREFSYYSREYQPQLVKKPMLIITTAKDQVIDYRQSIEWFKKVSSPKQLAELPLSDHGLNQEPDAKLTVKTITAWLRGTFSST